MIRVVYTEPPKRVYDECVRRFGASFDDGTVFTHGDTIHTKYPISDDLFVHESTHAKQQSLYGIIDWWDRYFIDDKFRLEQELEAYRAQYKFMASREKDRNALHKFLHRISTDLSSDLYGKCITYQEALNKIKNGN